MMTKRTVHKLSDLRVSGLLAALNDEWLHPQGLALGLAFPEGTMQFDETDPIGWVLLRFPDGIAFADDDPAMPPLREAWEKTKDGADVVAASGS